MVSSYDRVSRHICESNEFKRYLSVVKERLSTLHFSHHRFEITSFEPLDVKPIFFLDFAGSEKPRTTWHKSKDDVLKFRIDLDFIFPHDEIHDLAKKFWDQKLIPTYNCKFYYIKDGPKNQKCLSNLFPEFARDFIKEHYEDLILETNLRIRKEFLSFFERPDLSKLKSDFVEKTAVEEIKRVLYKFRHVEERVILSAFKEFVVSELLTE